MSKHKHKHRNSSEYRFDRDHLLWIGADWERGDARILRQNSHLITTLDRQTHEERHRNTPAIQVLSKQILRRTVCFFEEGETPLDNIDNLQCAIEKATHHHDVTWIEREIAQRALHALDLTKPYWAEAPAQRRCFVDEDDGFDFDYEY